MMKLVFALVFLTASMVFAGTHEATISSIDYGRTASEEHLLYLSDGHVIKIPSKDRKDLKNYENLYQEHKIVRFKVDSTRKIKSYKVIGKAKLKTIESVPAAEYQPTILSSMEEASKIFRNLRRGASSSSQCYNRAHVWVYESKNSYNLNSMKVFMFYTRKYIRQYNFEWWFHVAPFAYVQENENVVEKVLDFKFTRGPTSMKPWTDHFMRNKVVCPEITKYSDYENHEEEQYCYLYKVSMYYLQPLDLDNLERTGSTKTKFLDYEVKRAYRNFDSWWKN